MVFTSGGVMTELHHFMRLWDQALQWELVLCSHSAWLVLYQNTVASVYCSKF